MLQFGWPVPPKIPQFALPRGLISGKRKAIVLSVASDLGKKGPVTSVMGTLSETRTDFGRNRATIRLP